jgi:hypothetical protein
VLVAPDETHLLDLGVAGALHAVGLRPPAHAPYAAPETVQGGAPSRAADVFSLGAVAFELLAGEAAPGLGDAALSRLPDIPGAHRETLEETFAFALAEPTDERFPTALGLAAALKRALADAPGHWVAPRPAVSPAAGGGTLPDLAAPLPVEDAGVASPHGRPALADVPHDVEQPAFDAPVEPAGSAEPPEPGDLVLRAAERADEAKMSPGDRDGGEPHRFMDLSVETGGAPTDPRGDDELPVALPDDSPPGADDDARPGPQWDDVEPQDSPPEPAAPVVRAPRPRIAADSHDGAARTRTIATAGIAILVLLAAVAAGYLWGRQAGEPARVGAPGVGTGVALGGTDEAGAGDTVEPSDTAVELEMPPEPIPEGEGAAQPAAPSPAPAREAAQPADASRQAPASAPPRSTAAPARAPAPTPTGQLSVGSTPAGARVEVNGKPSGETPLTLRGLALGAYDITVTRQGYVSERRRVTLTRGRPSQSVTVPMRRRVAGTKGTAQPAETHASVLVDSRPRGAAVYLDGRLVGTTPLQLAEVSAGRHVFRLELPGHRRWADTVQIVGGERHRVAASLEEETR